MESEKKRVEKVIYFYNYKKHVANENILSSNNKYFKNKKIATLKTNIMAILSTKTSTDNELISKFAETFNLFSISLIFP